MQAKIELSSLHAKAIGWQPAILETPFLTLRSVKSILFIIKSLKLPAKRPVLQARRGTLLFLQTRRSLFFEPGAIHGHFRQSP